MEAASRKGSPQEAAGKLEPRWAKAILLGLVPLTLEIYAWDGQRALRARDVRRTTEGER